MVHQDANVGVAFALVIGAGAATALGASVVFFPFLVKLASRRVLAGALGASAGVMLYVSFIDIFQKTMGYFDEAGNTPEIAFAYTTCCFFGGIVFMMVRGLTRTKRYPTSLFSIVSLAHLLYSSFYR